ETPLAVRAGRAHGGLEREEHRTGALPPPRAGQMSRSHDGIMWRGARPPAVLRSWGPMSSRAAGSSRATPNVTYFNEVDTGGHFAAWEEPHLFSEEIRAAFRSLRSHPSRAARSSSPP